jgi:NAD(P)-dependent dehydrogenase (short-subunit alcohol dehydrogenase family)
MQAELINELFDLKGLVGVVTGGAGVLCAYLCQVLSKAGARLAILDIDHAAADKLADQICHSSGEAISIGCDVTCPDSVRTAADEVISSFGKVDVLLNGAGGNLAHATTSPESPFFDLPMEAMQSVVDLNLMGTICCSQVFGKIMGQQKQGVILNISSMNALRPLTRIPAYSAAKAAVSNFTQWLAVYMAHEISPAIRVNAIAPGFFITEQNRYLLIESESESDKLTARGQAIFDHTPMQRFGQPEDLAGTVLWLISPASAFVTGIVVPVDGGFSAFSGV